jgi:hypothetical protein
MLYTGLGLSGDYKVRSSRNDLQEFQPRSPRRNSCSGPRNSRLRVFCNFLCNVHIRGQEEKETQNYKDCYQAGLIIKKLRTGRCFVIGSYKPITRVVDLFLLSKMEAFHSVFEVIGDPEDENGMTIKCKVGRPLQPLQDGEKFDGPWESEYAQYNVTMDKWSEACENIKAAVTADWQ